MDGVWGNRRSVRQEDTEIKSEEDVPAERTDTNQLAFGLFKDLKDSLQNAGYIHLTESEKKELKEFVGGQNPAAVEIVSPITIVQKNRRNQRQVEFPFCQNRECSAMALVFE